LTWLALWLSPAEEYVYRALYLIHLLSLVLLLVPAPFLLELKRLFCDHVHKMVDLIESSRSRSTGVGKDAIMSAILSLQFKLTKCSEAISLYIATVIIFSVADGICSIRVAFLLGVKPEDIYRVWIWLWLFNKTVPLLGVLYVLLGLNALMHKVICTVELAKPTDYCGARTELVNFVKEVLKPM
jgi:hypothetical protein